MFVLLFPFYWMALTAIKPDEQLLDMEKYSPFWTSAPTLKHINKLLFETAYPRWLWNTMYRRRRATVAVARSPACSPPMRSCACASGARRWSAG